LWVARDDIVEAGECQLAETLNLLTSARVHIANVHAEALRMSVLRMRNEKLLLVYAPA
jgi:hypothetical protein